MADIRQILNELGYGNYAEVLASQLTEGGLTRNNLSSELGGRLSTYKGLFESLVGRAPNDDELRTIFSNVAPREALSIGNVDSQTRLRDSAAQFIGDTFQKQAQDYAQEQLQAQQGKANELAGMFRTQGNQAISATEQSLLDYQQRLFDKLRPNLITSLAAQGLLDTGGLNTAVAGAQADLANSVTPFLAEQRLANEQQANAIAFSGASAPYEYRNAQIMNQVPYLQSQGQGAIDRNYNTFLQNLNFQNQLALQRQAQGGRKTGSFLQNIGTGLATSLGNFLSPTAATEAYKNYGTGYNQLKQGKNVGVPGVVG